MIDPHGLSVIIPSYNAREALRSTLQALLRAVPGAEVIVIDGESPDDSAGMVRREFPAVRLLAEKNHGFAYAINRGLEEASGDYLLLLNSDLLVIPEAIESMMSQLARSPDLGAVAPVLVNPDGSRQQLFSWLYWPNWSKIRQVTSVPLLSAACLLTRRDVVLKLGGLDETLFFYNEEFDWCIRARRAGYCLRLVPERVVHLGGASTPSRNPAFKQESVRGFVYVVSKHFSSWFTARLAGLLALLAALLSLQGTALTRAMRLRLAAQLRRRAYSQSTFPVSGRGAFPATPDWASCCLVRKGPQDSASAGKRQVDPPPEPTRP